MKNMRMSVKLIGGFSIVAFLTLVVGYFGYIGIEQTMEALEETCEVRLPSIIGLETMSEAQTSIQGAERVLVYERNPELVRRYSSQLEDGWKRAGEGWKIYEPLPQTKEEENMWKEFVPKWEAWKKLHLEVIELVKKGDYRGAHTLTHGNARNAFYESEKLLLGLVDLNKKIADDFEKEALAAGKFDELIALVGMIVGTLVALGLGIFLTRSIIKPINKVVEGLTDGSEQVASASSQVSSASQSLAEGASEQAAGIEETSSSIEEMSSMTRQNADNANQANLLMSETTKVVEEANRSMAELTGSMKEISTASEETAKIIKTIDEIAFQTNLLALNAAVEAARAGEAGAGFAVVADEVRNLAMRAADAAKNTANLIEGTVKKIKNGSDTVSKTNEAFAKVAAGAKKVGELVGEISAASQEQAQGIDQINKAVSEMDRVVQKNAASAEESASASEEMNAQAETMKGFVSELVALVGGRNGNGIASVGAIHESPVRGSEIRKSDGNGKRHVGLPVRSTQTSRFVARVTDGAKKKDAKVPALIQKEPKPEQVIPMEEGNFKEF